MTTITNGWNGCAFWALHSFSKWESYWFHIDFCIVQVQNPALQRWDINKGNVVHKM